MKACKEKKLYLLRSRLLGLEGKFARFYFNQVFKLFSEEIRPMYRSSYRAYDGVNNMFNLSYRILFWKCYRGLIKGHLEPYLGYLHKMEFGRPSMVCDFLELYRHLVDGFLMRARRLLMTMPGIGFFTASLLVAEIGDINRFGSDKKISSWATLAPRINQSGEKTHIGRVSGPGNKRVAAMMVQCAHTACRFDARFKRFYERYSRRKGKGKAAVAVAHEMIRIVYFMLKNNEPYRGQNVELTVKKLKRMEGRASYGLRT